MSTQGEDNADIINAYLGKAGGDAEQELQKTGYVAVVGQPNVGKSTLVNALVGAHVAITSSKAQTTRRRILGILNRPGVQIVFIDTPGIHQPKQALNKFMMREVEEALAEADAVLFVVDVSQRLGDADRAIAQRMARVKQPVYLAMNKSDQLDPRYVVENVGAYEALIGAPEVPAAGEATAVAELWRNNRAILTSATRGDNLDKLTDMLLGAMHAGPELYPQDQVTDQNERTLAAEFVREQALRHLNEEVPHAVAVQVDEFTERDSGGAYIAATIFVERESQKGIIIGNGGKMLKLIGSGARKMFEQETGRKVFLELWVKVREKWRDDDRQVSQLV